MAGARLEAPYLRGCVRATQINVAHEISCHSAGRARSRRHWRFYRATIECALSFIAEIETRFAKIAATPHLHRLRDEVMPGIRAAVHGRYLIYFRCEDDGDVVFLRVLHGAREQAGGLFDH